MIIKEHAEFTRWMSKQSVVVKMLISTRLLRIIDGNFGDAKSVGDGVSELRFHKDGWRVYYTRRGKEIVILLCGGNKSSQKRDIKKAKDLNKEV